MQVNALLNALTTTCKIMLPIMAVAVVVWGAYLLFNKTSIRGQKSRYKIKKLYKAYAIFCYGALTKFWPTHMLVKNMALSFKSMYVLDEEESNIKAITTIMTEIVTGIATFIICLKYLNDTMMSLIVTYMIVVYVYQKIRGDGQKFLEELEETIGDMLHMYNAENRNMERMFNRILDDRHSYMHRYINQMHIYLKKATLNPESQHWINEYNNIAASRHLRLIFNYIYITSRFGDEVNANGEQLFNRNMLAIQREVHSDCTKIQRIKEETMGEQLFIVLAVLMIPAADWYMKNFFTFDGFETVARFLDSSLGYAIKMGCSVFALICYYVYVKIMASNVILESGKGFSWEENVFMRAKWLKTIVTKISPKVNTPKRAKLEYNLALVGGANGIRGLYLRKLLMAISVCIIVTSFLSIDTYTSYSSISKDIYRGINKASMDTVLSVNSDDYEQRSIVNDLEVIDILKQKDIKEHYFTLSDENKVGYIREVIRDNNIDYGIYPEIAAQRIFEKYVLIGEIDIRIITLVVLLATFGAYMIPNLAIRLNITLNKGAIIYDEVIGCYTVVVLLINHSSSNVYMLLNWLTSFSNVFKGRFQSCIDNLSEKEIIALEAGVKYKPLSRLIESLLLAYKGTDLKAAFAGVEQRHLFQEENRRNVNEMAVKRRVYYSQALSWSAMSVTFALYIVGPMIVSIAEMLLQLL